MDDPRDQLLNDILARLVTSPEDVMLNVVPHSRGVIYEVVVAESDVGRVLGKSGNTIKAIKTLMIAVWARDRKHVQVKLPQADRT